MTSIAASDEEFDNVTEAEELATPEKLETRWAALETRWAALETRWAALEAMVGDDDRLKVVAKDLVEHFEKWTEAMDGKGMISCLSRRICVDLYSEIIALRPSGSDNGCFTFCRDGAARLPFRL